MLNSKNQQLTEIMDMLEKQNSHIDALTSVLSSTGAFPFLFEDEPIVEEDSLCTGSFFERIADIVIARRNAKQKMRQVYERDQYMIRTSTDPGNVLTADQKKEIEEFWGRYSFAYKNDPEIQRYFSGISGRFDATYIGFGLQYYYLNRYWNHITVALIRNKNFLDLIFPTVKMPKVIVRNMWARYYTPDRKLITESQAIELVRKELATENVEQLIVKPDDGEEGKGVLFLNKNDTPETIKQVFSTLREKFIVQEVIKNHSSYAAPHAGSLNTLRIATIFNKNQVRLVGTVWRMGRDKQVDNWAAGGIACAVSQDGICADFAEDHYGNRYSVHPNGFHFAGHKLYNCKAAIDTAIQLHYTLPQLRYISWDFAINEQGEPVLIELNSCGSGELLEMNGYPCYIDKPTLKAVLDEYLLRRFYYDRVNWNWNYREYHDHVEIVKYGGWSKTVRVPLKLRGKPVTQIAKSAFSNTSLEEIRIPEKLMPKTNPPFANLAQNCKITVISDQK